MKQQIEQIIDRLADKSLTFGCRVRRGQYIRVKDKVEIEWQEYTVLEKAEQDNEGNKYFDDTYLVHDFNRHYGDFNGKRLNIPLIEDDDRTFEILGHPVWVTRFLARLPQIAVKLGKRTQDLEDDLITAWRKCDETLELSANEIFGPECEWEDLSDGIDVDDLGAHFVPVDPAKKALAELLIKLFKHD